MPSLPDPFALLGTTFRGRHYVESFAGVGRFSAVYRVTDTSTERPVALRLLKVKDTLTPSRRTIVLERLRSLTRPLSEVATRCSSVADVSEVAALTTAAGRWMPVVVQTWLEGETLEGVLTRERREDIAPRTLDAAMALLTPVADALGYAHSRGFAHGSLSPRNLFVRDAGREDRAAVDILDLGMAQVLEAMQEKDRAFAEPPDGPIYFFTATHGSPEHFAADRVYLGPASDVFALALIVAELVTGVSLLGEGDDAQLQAVAADPTRRPTPRTHRRELGGYVEGVFERALAVKPHDRYASVSAFWEALRAASRMTTLRPSSSTVRSPSYPALPAEGVPPSGLRDNQQQALRRRPSGFITSPQGDHPPPSARDGVPSSRREAKPPPGFFETPPTSSTKGTNPLFAGQPRERAQ